MSRSRLRNKWMRKRYAKVGRFVVQSKMKDIDRNPHRLDEMPKNRPSRYITTHCSDFVYWLQEPGSFGGHRIPKGGRDIGELVDWCEPKPRKRLENTLKRNWRLTFLSTNEKKVQA